MTTKRWPAFLAWDGALPLFVATSLDFLRLFLGRDAAEILAVLLVPMIAAILRCAIAMKQLSERGADVGWVRPCLLSGAIVVLMFFEGAANLLRCNGVPFAEVAPFTAALYALYLLMIWLAFSERGAPASPFGEFPDAR